MKRRIAFALCAALLLTATGCTYAIVTQESENAYSLYFREANLEAAPGGDALRAETIYLDDEEENGKLPETLLLALLEGPQDMTLQSVIPSGTSLLSLEVKGNLALVDLSSQYSSLSGVMLTMADYAITLTLTQLPEISIVKVTVRGRELAYRDRQNFTVQDMLLSSTEDVVGSVEAWLYFLDENGNLAGEGRTIDLYEGDTQVGAVVSALEKGPEGKELEPVLPEGFEVKSVWLEEKTCYVNLLSLKLADLPQGKPMQTAILALARSLNGLDTVKEVQFLVDGEFTAVYGAAGVANPYRE